MAALLLKSTNALDASVGSLDFFIYKQRVINDGGFIADEQAVKNAFSFVLSSGINPSEVFSATSANWGVKIESGIPKKLYTLFGTAGDINVTASVPSAIVYNTTDFNTPVVELKANAANGLQTISGANNVGSSGIFIISKVPMLATGGAYGVTNTPTMGTLSNLTTSVSAGETLDKRMNALNYKRTSSTALADVFTYGAASYGSQGLVTSDGIISNASVWRGMATFTAKGVLELINNGSVIAVDNTVNEKTWINDMYFDIGRSRDAALTSLAYTAPLYGFVSEAWCLINTTSAHMKALSTRQVVN